MATKMAKKTATTEKKSGFNFEEFDKQLSKIDGFELGSIIEHNTFSMVDEWIPTGNYLLNAQISGSLFGGIPNSRALGLVGDPETGKTFMCLNIAREAQKMGYDIIYCETEGAVDRTSVAKLGVDTTRLRYQPIKTVNEFKHFTAVVIDMIKKRKAAGDNPKIMLFLDSLGMLNTKKELDDALAGKEASDMGLKAKQLRALFRTITLDLTAAKIPLIVTNHTTIGNIGSYTGPTKESAGGDGPIFSLSTALLLSKKFQVDDANKSVKTGIIINTRPKKSRSTIPTTISIHVGFVGGMNPYVGLEEYLTWDACGIGKGKIMTEKEYKKSGDKSGQQFTHTYDEVDEKTGEIKTITEELVYVRNDNARWCVKHLGKSLSKGSMLFNKEVLTEDVLKALDVNVIQPAFKLPDHATQIEDLLDDEDVDLAEFEE